MNPVPHFVSVPSHIIGNPVPHSNFSGPVGGSVVYDSGTGEDFFSLISLEGTDPLFSIQIHGLALVFIIVDQFLSGYRSNRATSLNLCFGSGFCMDPF